MDILNLVFKKKEKKKEWFSNIFLISVFSFFFFVIFELWSLGFGNTSEKHGLRS